MAMDATEADSARLLNDVDDFQRTILGLLDELEQKHEGRSGKGAVEEKGIKREAEEGTFCGSLTAGLASKRS